MRTHICRLLLLAILAQPALSLAAAVQLVLLDGSIIPADLERIENDRIHASGPATPLTLDDLQRIEIPSAKVEPLDDPAAILDFATGRLLARSLHIAEEQCRFAWAGSDHATLPLDALRAIQLSPFTASPEFARALATPQAASDRIFLRDEAGALTSLTGVIHSLSQQQLQVEVGGKLRDVPRAKLAGLVIAQPPMASQPPRLTLALHDGSQLSGSSLSLHESQATLQLAPRIALQFPWSAVLSVAVRSQRVQFLSDLKPLNQEQQAIVTLPLPAQFDRSASGGPLVLGSRTYEKGLGVHARSSLTFATSGKFDQFAATIGLDPHHGAHGDCLFQVLADGEPLFTKRLKGSDPPLDVQLGITGRQQLTLRVEPGPALDMGDHANWCHARFLRNQVASP